MPSLYVIIREPVVLSAVCKVYEQAGRYPQPQEAPSHKKRERHAGPMNEWLDAGGGVYFVECLQLRICLVSLFALILNNNET